MVHHRWLLTEEDREHHTTDTQVQAVLVLLRVDMADRSKDTHHLLRQDTACHPLKRVTAEEVCSDHLRAV